MNYKSQHPQTDSDKLDALIDTLIATPAPKPTESFTESVLAAARKADAENSRFDKTSDRLIARLKDFPDARVSEKVFRSIKSIRSNFWNAVFAYSAAATVAACAAFAVFNSTVNATLPKGVVTANDFAQMSKMSDEITSIAVLVVQEEILDIIKR